jgi:germination protein YpeB
MKKGKGALADTLGRLEGSTLEENNLTPNGNAPQMDRAGTKQTKDAVRISTAKAEELCKAYFAKYNIKDFQCVGETNARGGALYNVQGYDDRGTQLYAEVDEYTGKLVRFDFFEECNGDKFDKESCAKIAEEFLTSLGYQDMTLVRARRNGSTLDFTYAVEQDGIIIYPDSVRVKVCGTRGVVSGFDGGRYLKNHRQRENLTTAISVEEAESRLQKGVEVEGSRLAVVQTAGGERTAYEFVCSFMEERYLIYIDAVDGNEISIINLKTIA